MNGKQVIDHLQLIAHPEGGFYREMYRSTEAIEAHALPQRFNGVRDFSTAIYFLLMEDDFSAFHKIQQDELWHFYRGTPLTLHSISPNGTYTKQVVGSNIEEGETPLAVIKAGDYFAAEVLDGEYALLGCTVAPGFDFKDFELSKRAALLSLFPQHADLIRRMTRA